MSVPLEWKELKSLKAANQFSMDDVVKQLGYGSGMTCWRRLKEWQQAGVFQALHECLLAQLRAAGRLDLSRAVCDSASLRALLGARKPVPAPLTGANSAANTT